MATGLDGGRHWHGGRGGKHGSPPSRRWRNSTLPGNRRSLDHAPSNKPRQAFVIVQGRRRNWRNRLRQNFSYLFFSAKIQNLTSIGLTPLPLFPLPFRGGVGDRKSV